MQKIAVMALALMAIAPAQAQTDARREPVDPAARVPPVQYRSAFADYQAYREPQLAKWREANEEVKGAGRNADHAGHGGQAAKPGAAPTPKPPAGGHAGHQ